MFTSFHFFLLLHDSSLPSKKPLLFSFLKGVSRPGAHPNVRAPPMARTPLNALLSPSIIIVTIVFFQHLFVAVYSETDAEILLMFKDSLENTEALSNWDNATSPCDGHWRGIHCDKGRLWAIKLEHLGLSGFIDVDMLTKLKNLRSVSFMNNNFEGALPNLTRLGALKNIYLSNNRFSGEIPSTYFYSMMSLKKLHLANNTLSGPIPSTLATLPRLIELMLENNEFQGELPRFLQDRLKAFNVSNNYLVGEIPVSLSHFKPSSFSGNSDLCGAPLEACEKKSELSMTTIVVVSVLVAAAVVALLAVVIILLCRKKPSPESEGEGSASVHKEIEMGDAERMEGSKGKSRSSSSPDSKQPGVRLTFLRDEEYQFDMADLLKASAEVLGSGAFGSTYKAALSDGKVMVVKRFRHMNNVGKEEFNEHMRRLGRLSHHNVLPIIAFYYRKEEKLIVADYVENFSLAFQLHGNRSLDWPTRLNIVKGIAKGLQYLYNELPSLTAPHGHLKSSNVLLDGSFEPLLADYGLVPVVNQEHAQEQMISYKSPEYKESRRITKKTDIWSLGILILEILTGRFPSDLLQKGSGGEVDLGTWVASVMKDTGGGAVFDRNMVGTSHSQGEMMKLLKIGLSCCQGDVDKRPDIKEVVDLVEEVKEKDIDDDFYSSYASESDMRSSRGLSDDFRGINL